MANEPIILGLVLVAGLALGYFLSRVISTRSAESLENRLKGDLEKAKNQAQDIILEAKTKAVELLEDVKKEEVDRRLNLDKREDRLLKHEEELAKDSEDLKKKETDIELEKNKLAFSEVELARLKDETKGELSKIAGLTPEQAKKSLLDEIEKSSREELALTMQKLIRERREEVEKKSVEIITTAIQRYARSNVGEVTTSSYTLPSEEFKGKIIGREGRNVKALERLTGVEIIIDETPETIIISSFDPMRREIARMTIEKLIKDGRIQPAKIEEKVEESRLELDNRILEIGQEAAYELGILDFPKEILQLLGRLNFRTSFGQNVLIHSIEMAHISGMIAAELGLNVEVVKKGALVHDIGKAIDHEVQGTHVDLGKKILKKYGIGEQVILAMQSHHDEYPYETPEAFIVTTADILSAARPGARRGTVENYIKRLEDLEKIAMSFPGIKNSYAIAAGRELRVFVVPEQIDDFRALQLARDIANKIESELKYPGEIKVNVIREMRAVEYAK